MQISRPGKGRFQLIGVRLRNVVCTSHPRYANGREPMVRSRSTLSMSFVFVSCAVATLALSPALAQGGPAEPGLPTQPADASPRELRVLGGRTDYSVVKPVKASPRELPTWRIPN